MNVAILIPTIKGREIFLNQALNLLSEQTVQPAFVEIVKDDPITNEIDVAWRYKIGINRCREKGADIIIFWEDDDWYKYNYIELMLKYWILNQRPDIFGLSKTIYYNIVHRVYTILTHPIRASMMSTMITKNVIPNWSDDHNPYLDLFLWTKANYKKVPFPLETPIAVGIKHGIGKVAGTGHTRKFKHYRLQDSDLSYLSSIIDKDSLNFYKSFYNEKKH